MQPDMVLKHHDHQAVDAAAYISQQHQNIGAMPLAGEGPLDSVYMGPHDVLIDRNVLPIAPRLLFKRRVRLRAGQLYRLWE